MIPAARGASGGGSPVDAERGSSNRVPMNRAWTRCASDPTHTLGRSPCRAIGSTPPAGPRQIARRAIPAQTSSIGRAARRSAIPRERRALVRIAASPIFDKFRGLTKRSRARDPVYSRDSKRLPGPFGCSGSGEWIEWRQGAGRGRKRRVRSGALRSQSGRSVRFLFFWGPIEGERSLANRCIATSRPSCAH